MKKLLLFGVICVAGVLHAAAPAGAWKLVWSDEFNTPGAPDPAKWKCETGFNRNQELQYYTDSPENVRVKDGCLEITARRLKKPLPNPGYKPGSKDWRTERPTYDITSTSLMTGKRFFFRYGRVEMRAQLPEGAGVWPALWTLGRNPPWPDCGEIDILEFFYGKRDGKRVPRIHTAIHWKGLDGNHKQCAKGLNPQDWEGEFHIFALEWDAERIRIMYDGTVIQNVLLSECANEPDAFHKAQFLVVNLAIGGALGGEVDPGIFPAVYKIDYIRVYQKDGIGATVNQ